MARTSALKATYGGLTSPNSIGVGVNGAAAGRWTFRLDDPVPLGAMNIRAYGDTTGPAITLDSVVVVCGGASQSTRVERRLRPQTAKGMILAFLENRVKFAAPLSM